MTPLRSLLSLPRLPRLSAALLIGAGWIAAVGLVLVPAAAGQTQPVPAAEATPAAGAPGGPPLVLADARVHPVSGPAFDGSVLVRNGRIEALGETLDIPPDAERVDLSGLHLFPGFVHAASGIGLTEIGSVDGTVDLREIGQLHPDLRVEAAFNADSMLLPVTAAGGVLTAHVVPGGALVAGTSAVMRVDTGGPVGRIWEGAVVRAPVGLHLRFPRTEPPSFSFFGEPPTQEEVDETFDEALATLDTLFRRARHHIGLVDQDLAAAGSAPRLEALAPVISGEVPVFLHARHQRQIQKALDWAEAQELQRLVLVTRQEVTSFAARLAEARIPVILQSILALPERGADAYDAPYTTAATLRDAGVTFAIADSGSGFGASNARNLPFHAAMAVAFGLTADEALAAITLTPAQILGVAQDLGSLEPGKEATLVVADGSPLEASSRILRAWQLGRELDLDDNRHHRLYRQYLQRSAP